ncbi:chemotaxis protein CheD [Catenuloplanes sp. NPDC051500]|uniref:chemotaxis protein CheD n=1 Tax=Catenuloplanes sp. NPDC051500 TaxID=3363959 RepID=UPI003795A587
MASVAEVVLNPGEFYFGGADTRIHTLLGSCVSITLWHPRRQVGGMCHYMLPTRRLPGTLHRLDGRYADHAVRMFLHEIERQGTRPSEYVARMFGGGNQFPPAQRRGRAPDIARDNIAAGLALLDRHGFHLAETHLGGRGARRLTFDIATGDVALHSAAQQVS